MNERERLRQRIAEKLSAVLGLQSTETTRELVDLIEELAARTVDYALEQHERLSH
jgi:hypothetical protein